MGWMERRSLEGWRRTSMRGGKRRWGWVNDGGYKAEGRMEERISCRFTLLSFWAREREEGDLPFWKEESKCKFIQTVSISSASRPLYLIASSLLLFPSRTYMCTHSILSILWFFISEPINNITNTIRCLMLRDGARGTEGEMRKWMEGEMREWMEGEMREWVNGSLSSSWKLKSGPENECLLAVTHNLWIENRSLLFPLSSSPLLCYTTVFILPFSPLPNWIKSRIHSSCSNHWFSNIYLRCWRRKKREEWKRVNEWKERGKSWKWWLRIKLASESSESCFPRPGKCVFHSSFTAESTFLLRTFLLTKPSIVWRDVGKQINGRQQILEGRDSSLHLMWTRENKLTFLAIYNLQIVSSRMDRRENLSLNLLLTWERDFLQLKEGKREGINELSWRRDKEGRKDGERRLCMEIVRNTCFSVRFLSSVVFSIFLSLSLSSTNFT